MSDLVAQQYLFQALKQRRRKMTDVQRKRRPPRVRVLYPYAIEAAYAKQISAWLQPLITAVDKYMEEHGEQLLKGDSMQFHADAAPGVGFQLLIDTLSGWVGQYFAAPADKQATAAVVMGIGNFADATKGAADKNWMKSMMSLIGSEFTTANAWWPGMKKTWTDLNYKLIKSVSERYIGDVSRLAESAVTNGYSYVTLKRDILALGKGLKTWQANRLARDQIGKLNGMITQNQSLDAGFEMYEWLTAGDKRVRTEPLTHVALNDKLCSWKDATVFSIDKGKTWTKRPSNWEHQHPGMAIQCRCTAAPYAGALLEEVDRELAQEAK